MPTFTDSQEANKKRLVSNLRYSYKQLLNNEQACEEAEITAALIDGFWLRCALSGAQPDSFEAAKRRIKKYISAVLEHNGVDE